MNSPHIRNVRSKVARSVGVLGKAREVLNYKSLLTLYNTLIIPYLSYCAEVWGNTYRSNIQPLTIIQKRAIRIVNKVGYYDHTNTLFLNSQVMKFIDLINYRTALFMYKVRNKLVPGNILKLFRDREGGYNFRWDQNLKQSSANTTRKSMCISVCGVKIWNGLTEAVKHSTNIIQFKNKLKHLTLAKYNLD